MIDFDAFIFTEMESTKEDIEPLYRIYIGEMEDMIEKLKEAISTDDLDGFKRLLHNVKGINANLRINPLLEPVTQMYSRLKSGDEIDLNKSLDIISAHFEQVKIEIEKYFE
ncbi:Hpt domain-containing protein [Fusibacter sp. JL216-2]|uniref:Hpt domain-containing protein n=1 Tax=Fusibacter sp. JL216-2 TaxID=3071453 RepID=UPI003D34038C